MNVSKLVVGLVVASFSLVSFAQENDLGKGNGNLGKAAVMKKMNEPTKKEKLATAKKKQLKAKVAKKIHSHMGDN